MATPDYNYLENLNPQQRAAVEYIDGPQLVIAGAGSGKTRVLTYKLVHLIRSGIQPERIMALTFTNKAAREMQSRIEGMLDGRNAHKVWSGTFHSVFLRILRRHADRIGFRSNFTIYDTADTKNLLKSIIKEMELDDKIYKVSAVASSISNAKNGLITPDMYLADMTLREADKNSRRPLIGEIYRRYSERCRIAQSMDFDDILLYINILFRDNDDIREKYAEWFRYILVDEYQDTNFAQHLIVKMLSSRYNGLCVVGDDAQSIYSFRGANINNILTLEKRYPGLKTFKLERNYRSTRNIVSAADSLISKNTRQIRKNVFSEKEDGEKLRIVRSYSDLEEATMVASMIMESRNKRHDSLEDYAVLYRTNAQSRPLEEALRKKSLAYRIYGGLAFYQRKEIKDAIAYFRLAVNPDDDEALKRIINFPARGIGDVTLKKLVAAASEHSTSILETIRHIDLYDLKINSGTRTKLEKFAEMIDEFVEDNKTSDAYDLAQLVYNRTGILSVFSDEKTPEEISKKENLIELLTGLKEFSENNQEGDKDTGMTAFLNEVSLATDQDEADTEGGQKVTLMTAHAAKGLEFKHIYIVGVEEELFPSTLSMDSLVEIEEERRLLYVAITRAMETCTLTYSSSRFRNGQTTLPKPSRFLSEIDRRNVDIRSSFDILSPSTEAFSNPIAGYQRKQFSSGRSKKISSHDYTDVKKLDSVADGKLYKGVKIKHNIFGTGEIESVENVAGDDILIVRFKDDGTKKLMLKYAKFTIMQ